jgi:hypothetical protein
MHRPMGPLARARAILRMAASHTSTGAGLLTPERVALPIALGTAPSGILAFVAKRTPVRPTPIHLGVTNREGILAVVAPSSRERAAFAARHRHHQEREELPIGRTSLSNNVPQ